MFAFKSTPSDQERFARLSGDWNPLHVDPVEARRLLYGVCVVHGIHGVIHALDCWAGTLKAKVRLTKLRAAFQRPIAVHDTVDLAISSASDSKATLELSGPEGVATKVQVEWVLADTGAAEILDESPPREAPDVVIEPRSGSLHGKVALMYDAVLATEAFPGIEDNLCRDQVSVLLASTRLLGMKCPGLHSLYSELDLEFDDPSGRWLHVEYELRGVDSRFGLLDIGLSGAWGSASVKAFLRPVPRPQLSFSETLAIVKPGCFDGQRPLVVGGSRGLGEVCAKMLAAGGAEVLLSYHRGEADAERVVAEITSAGYVASAVQLDVLEGSDRAIHGITHVYYFATPRITPGKKGAFSVDRFRRFSRYYVEGLMNVLRRLNSNQLAGVMYPSTVYVDEVPSTMAEYAAAKSAGETLCRYLAKCYPEWRVAWPKFPRVATDQTAAIIDRQDPDPAPVMYGFLAEFMSG